MSVDLKTQVFQQIEILDFSCIKILMIDDNRKDIELVKELLEVEGDFKFSFHGGRGVGPGLVAVAELKE